MKKIRVGVIGYGNLGKSVEELVSGDEAFELVSVFSKRNVKVASGKVDFTRNIHKYKNRIDVMFLCGGSSSCLMEEAQRALENFCCIDAFDTHKKIAEHVSICDAIAKQNKKVVFCSIGWDPGLFSLMRVLLKAVCGDVFTTWGKGVSQGHSEAIRCIKGVKDAIQYTIPNKKIVQKIKKGKIKNLDNIKELHSRLCYVVALPEHQKSITQKITNMPNYFKGYKTKVVYVSEMQMLKHGKMCHAGEVFTSGGELCFKLQTKSNPDMTAKIMTAYAKVLFEYLKREQFGAYTILQIPIAELLNNSKKYI